MSTLPDTSAVPDRAEAEWNKWQLRQALWAWTLRTTASTLTSQGFLVYYLLELKASDRLLGLAAALPSFAFAAQFAGSVWAERTHSRRRLCLRLFIANALCWLPTLAVGLWAAGSAERYPAARIVFVACLALMAVFFHLHSPAWDSLFSDAVPDKQKSVFLGKWGLWSGIGVAACSIVGGWLIEVVSRGQTAAVRQTMYLAVFAASLICSLVAGWFYSGVEDVPAQSERYSIRELIRLALAQRNYMTFMSVHAIRTIAMGVYAAFIIAWFRESLGMSILFLCFLGAWTTAISALVSPFWGRWVQQFGGKPVLTFGFVISMGSLAAYFFYTPANYRWVSVIHWGLFGLFISAYSVAVNTLWYALPQRKARTMQFAIAWTFMGIFGAIGAAAGGWIASRVPDMIVGPYHWSHYHWLVALAIVIHVPGFFFLRKIEEPGAHEPWVMAAWFLRRLMLRRLPG